MSSRSSPSAFLTTPVRCRRGCGGLRYLDAWAPPIRSAGGVIAVLSLALYPYVYLLARSAFLTQGRRAVEAAQTLGVGVRDAAWKVALPLARPWIAAGVALVAHGDAGRFRRRRRLQLQHVHHRDLSRVVRHVLHRSRAGAGRDPPAAGAARTRVRAARARGRALRLHARGGARVAASAVARRRALGRERVCGARVRAGVRAASPAAAVVGHRSCGRRHRRTLLGIRRAQPRPRGQRCSGHRRRQRPARIRLSSRSEAGRCAA